MNFVSFFILFLFSWVSLLHSALFPVLQVWGNYEFTKVVFFIIAIGIFSPFFLWKRDICLSRIWGTFLLWVFISFLFSPSLLISLTWWAEKWHGLLFFFSLFLSSGIFFQLTEKERKSIKKFLPFLLGCICIIAIKERFLPSYPYGDLSGRAFWTFGHPSYLSGILLFSFPFLFSQLKESNTPQTKILFILVVGALILTLQWLAILLLVLYIIIISTKNTSNWLRWGGITSLLSGGILLIFLFPEKLHSLLSRFPIWHTVINIIFSSPQTFFLWVWPEMLSEVFASYKTLFLYIFENFWFTADRAHNIFLDYWVQFGIIPVIILWYWTYFLIKTYKKNPVYDAIILVVLFELFNFPSITLYLLILFFLPEIFKNRKDCIIIHSRTLKVGLSLLLIWSAFITGNFYLSEMYRYKGNETKANQIYLLKRWNTYKSENDYRDFILRKGQKEQTCQQLTQQFPSAENYFFCWEVFKNIEKINISKEYYQTGFAKLPDLRNKNSPYWDNIFVSSTITGNRFFSPKYGDIKTAIQFVTNQ